MMVEDGCVQRQSWPSGRKPLPCSSTSSSAPRTPWGELSQEEGPGEVNSQEENETEGAVEERDRSEWLK